MLKAEKQSNTASEAQLFAALGDSTRLQLINRLGKGKGNDQDFAKASSIIEEQLTNAEPTEPWVCDKCAEENDGSFDFCWKCQAGK